MLSYQKIGTSTIQSRCTAGVTRGTYLFALPGSPGMKQPCLPEDGRYHTKISRSAEW